MADELADVVGAQAGRGQRVLDDLAELGDGEFVDLAPVHAEAAELDGVVPVVVGDLLPAAGHVQRPPHPAVGLTLLVQAPPPRVIVALEHDGAGGIAKEDGHGSLAEVDDGGHGIASDHANRPVDARSHERVGEVYRVDEPRAGGNEVERGGGGGSQGHGDAAGGRRAGHLGGDRGDDDQIQLTPLDAGVLKRAAQGIAGEGVGALGLRIDDPALADSGTLEDPLVRGVDHLLEVGVGEHLLGDGGPDPSDPNSVGAVGRPHATGWRTVSSLRVMFSFTRDWTSCLERTMVFVIVRATLEPWPIRHIPLTPSSGAPPYS